MIYREGVTSPLKVPPKTGWEAVRQAVAAMLLRISPLSANSGFCQRAGEGKVVYGKGIVDLLLLGVARSLYALLTYNEIRANARLPRGMGRKRSGVHRFPLRAYGSGQRPPQGVVETIGHGLFVILRLARRIHSGRGQGAIGSA